MNASKTTLKKLLYEHNIEANALLRAKYRDLETAITKYLNFIESTPAIQSFLEEVLDKHMPDNFNTSEKIKEVGTGHATFGPFPPDYKGESAVAYSILKTLINEHACYSGCMLYAYAGGSKKLNDKAEAFLEDVAGRLISGINRTLTLKGIEMGLDSNASQFNYFGNQGGAIASMAPDSALITVAQTNCTMTEELDTILKNLKESAGGLDADRQQAALEAVDAISDVLTENEPKPSIVKTIMNSLRSFNDCASFATNVMALTTFVLTYFPGLLS